MEKITTDIYSFENLRKGGYVYVDKTDLLWRLASEQEDRQFFISRPRRFGKSLMLSTLKCLFEGRKDLFKGLKIEKKRWDWKTTYPVVMLNMADVTASSVEELHVGLIDTVDELVKTYGLSDVARQPNPGKGCDFFKRLIVQKGTMDVTRKNRTQFALPFARKVCYNVCAFGAEHDPSAYQFRQRAFERGDR